MRKPDEVDWSARLQIYEINSLGERARVPDADHVAVLLGDLNKRMKVLEGMEQVAQEAIDGYRADELEELERKVDEFVKWVESDRTGQTKTTYSQIHYQLCHLGLAEKHEWEEE